MRHRRLKTCALSLSAALAGPLPGGAVLAQPAQPPAAATAPANDVLAGLWKARRNYGPDARGTLVLEKDRSGWTADFMGRRTPVTMDGGVLTFTLADGMGGFRARLGKEGGVANGQWFQPDSPANATFGTGVRFRPDGPGRWRGEVMPAEDTFTLYLAISRRPDGTLSAFLRNPERNTGVFQTVERVNSTDGRVEVMGRRGARADAVLMSGALDVERNVLHLYFGDRGGSFDFRREGDDSEFYPRGRTPAPYVYQRPLARADGWPTASLEEVGIDRPAIERFIQMIIDTPMDSMAAPQVEGVLIARHGKLVVEEYFHGEHRDKLHETRSAAKSLTATLVGAAIHAGLPVRLDDPVYKVINGGAFPDGLEPARRAMTLENLLTMSSGFFCDDGDPDAPGNEERMLDQTEEPDFYRYTMKVPLDRRPGERAVYCSADPNLAIGVLHRATGEHPMDLFDRLLGEPLQISRHAWYLSPSRQPYGGGSVRMVPRDFMKLGQLMLNDGVWNGRRILDRDFVRRASSPLYDLNRIKYGYLWWGIDFPYKDRTVHAYFAGGNGGQGVIVVPELDLVIATYGGSYNTRVGLEIQQGLTPRYILPAVRERGDDPKAPVNPRDFTVTYDRNR